jgi:hypothetical protein
MGYGGTGLGIYGGGTVLPWSEEAVLHEILQDVAKDRRIFLHDPRSGNRVHPQTHVIVLHPEFVNELHQKGFTGQSLRDYIIEMTAVPYEDLSENEIQGIKNRIADKSEVFFGSDIIPPDRIPVFEKSLKPGGRVPVVLSPRDIHIIVAGGITGYSFGFAYARGALQTKLIR